MRHTLTLFALATLLTACGGDPGPTFKQDDAPFNPACEAQKDCPQAPTDNNAGNRPEGRK
jgi:hypothetical protein